MPDGARVADAVRCGDAPLFEADCDAAKTVVKDEAKRRNKNVGRRMVSLQSVGGYNWRLAGPHLQYDGWLADISDERKDLSSCETTGS
jgi:hypothetical protein